MEFGLFCLMGYRQPGTPTAAIYDAAVAQVQAAEEAGFATAWFAEHHFSNYCVCPSPLMMVARCAGETRRIRLASGVVIAPLYNPTRLLSEIGMADALTHGRLVLGLGSGYQPYEFERFAEPLADSAAKLIEFMGMLDAAFGAESFTHAGAHYALPETHIAPRPPQGVPDIWIAGDNPALHRVAARRGHAVMVTPRHYSAALLAAARARIAESWRAEGRDPREMRFAALRPCCVTDDSDEADAFLEQARFQIRLSQSLRFREQTLAGAMLVEKPWVGEPTLAEMARHMLVGPAAHVAARLAEEIRAADPCHYLLQFQAGGSGTAQALRSIARFAGEVVPLLERMVGPLAEIGGRAPVTA